MTDVCRYGSSCWRLLCPYVHTSGRTRARIWAELWAWLAAVEDEERVQNRAAEQNMDIFILPFKEENVEVLQISPEETEFLEVVKVSLVHGSLDGVPTSSRLLQLSCTSCLQSSHGHHPASPRVCF